MKSSSYSGAARPRKRTGADHFGLFTLFLLLAASLALYIRLMATGMLSNLYLIILMMVLIVLNAVSVIVQLPLRRNKAGKLIMGIVSLLLSGAMLYGVVAVNSVQSALSKIVGKMTETEITEVRVMNDNPATSMGDTKGYTFGYIADADTKNTQSILDEISKSFGTIKSKGYDSMTALADAAGEGRLPGPMTRAAVGQKLGEVLSAYTLLTDPDYTKDSRVYLFEEASLRGWAVEIPKYAETDEAETPISAIRTTRADVCGLTVGKTTKAELTALLGEPLETRVYDADEAADRMLEAGESLFFALSGRILQAHVDENSVLQCLILRDAIPEALY
mgnify:CR=1 FL=1